MELGQEDVREEVILNMKSVPNSHLIKRAKDIAKIQKLNLYSKSGEVGCALITSKGNIYVGVSIDAPCGVGFCAEHSAIATMVTNQEYKIKKIVAITSEGDILPPCGRCREMMFTIDKNNLETEVILGKKSTKKLKDLLPIPWQNNLRKV